jgi:acetyl esterase
MTCEFDPLCDEGEAYAKRLSEAGVATTHHFLKGHIHGSPMFTRLLPSARDYHQVCVKALSDAFRK